MTAIQYGQRLNADSKFYELYQKGVELGTWDVEKLISQLTEQGLVEADKETWESMDETERNQWARLVSMFLDGETEVAQDASRLIQMCGSPHLEDSTTKEAYYATLALEEAKHTQLFAWYANEIIPDGTLSVDTAGIRRGSGRVPLSAGSPGFESLFAKQDESLKAASQPDATPEDIAVATTTYNLHVEGIIARGGYFIRNRFMEQAPLPALSKGFQLVSTDEGRHITAGMEIIKEMLAKEAAGEPEFEGISEAIWDRVLDDLADIYDVAIYITEDPGTEDNRDPLDADIDAVLNRFRTLYHDQYVETLDLPTWDAAEFAQHAGNQVDKCMNRVETGAYRDRIEEAAASIESGSDRPAASDGGFPQ